MKYIIPLFSTFILVTIFFAAHAVDEPVSVRTGGRHSQSVPSESDSNEPNAFTENKASTSGMERQDGLSKEEDFKKDSSTIESSQVLQDGVGGGGGARGPGGNN